jgi:hypothetical protein
MKYKAKMLGQVRSVLIALGGFAVGKGLVDESMMLEIVGGMVALIGTVWSWRDPAKKVGEGDIG